MEENKVEPEEKMQPPSAGLEESRKTDLECPSSPLPATCDDMNLRSMAKTSTTGLRHIDDFGNQPSIPMESVLAILRSDAKDRYYASLATYG